MKQNPFDSILPWRDRPTGGEALEDRAAALIRGSLAPGEPGDLQLQRIEQNQHARRWHSRRPALGLRLAVAAMLLVASVASVMAYQAARRAGWFTHLAPAALPAQPVQKSVGTTTPVEVDDRPAATEPAMDSPPEQAEKASAGERARRQTRVSRREVAGGSPQPAAVPEEILALDRAIGLLRQKRDPSAALPALDAYLNRFPGGVLNREARFARVDALLMLERSDEALAALETLPLDAHRRSTELQLIRGELRSRSQCVRAEEDFSSVLARDSDAALVERALYGRGACRAKRGDRTGAVQDLRNYIERFPNGAHAVWAGRWLDSASKSFANDGQVGGGPGH